MNNVMIDLESLGQEAGNVIVTLSAVQFDLETGEMGRIFDKSIKIADSQRHGLTIDVSTVLWWMGQNEDARMQLIESQNKAEDLTLVLADFKKWLSNLPNSHLRTVYDRRDIHVWGRGPRFDMALLSYAYKAIQYQETPWDFRKERCVRTYEALAPHIKKEFDAKREGTFHNGVDDAKHQIKYIVAIHQQLIVPKCQCK
jgi:hypothetical protein